MLVKIIKMTIKPIKTIQAIKTMHLRFRLRWKKSCLSVSSAFNSKLKVIYTWQEKLPFDDKYHLGVKILYKVQLRVSHTVRRISISARLKSYLNDQLFVSMYLVLLRNRCVQNEWSIGVPITRRWRRCLRIYNFFYVNK